MRTINQIGIELELAAYQDDTPIVAGRFISATKDKPLIVNGHMIHKDASMVELAMPPATCPRHMAALYTEAMAEAAKLVPDGVVLLANPSVEYTDDELAQDEYASVMGCSESRSDHSLPPMPREYRNNYRYGGMHVNIEVADAASQDALLLDAYLGLHSVVNWEQEFKDEIVLRRRYYGRAGEHRIKDFGIEYRTLPSCAFDPAFTEEVWELCNQALNANPTNVIAYASDICRAIQKCDSDMAGALIEEIHNGG